MLPLLCDIPSISYIELNKPKTEYIVNTTALVLGEKDYILNIENMFNKDLFVNDFLKYSGTTITYSSASYLSIIKEDLTEFYSNNYDLVIKLPEVITISRKMKIKNISKFSPKIIL
jgi:hypothetical protein